MGYIRPSIQEITKQIENDIYSRMHGTSRPARFSVNKILSRVLGGSVHLVYGYVEYIMKQILVDTADSEYLERHGLIWGVNRKPPIKAIGYIIFSGNVDSKIPAFTKVQTSDGFVFQTLFDVVVGAVGTCKVKIEAMIASSEGDLPSNTILTLISPIAGVSSICAIDTGGTYSGADLESDDSLRSRILDRIRNAPCAGNKRDYENWALEIPGVTRACCYPQYQGDGNVGLTFVRDNDENIIPNEQQLLDVYNFIRNVMPVAATLKIFAPRTHIVDFLIKSTDTSTEAVKLVRDQLEFLFFNVASPTYHTGTVVYLTEILEALSSLKQIGRMTLITPASDISIDQFSVGIVGKIDLESYQ